MTWFDAYMGKPWSAVPHPPQSFTCGELVRYVLRQHCGIDMPCILANAAHLRECLRDLGQPARYGLYPLPAGAAPQEYDVAYMLRSTRQDHVGLAVMTADGLMILHCQQNSGVVLDNPAELMGTGLRRIAWYRHKGMGGARCPV